MPIGTQGFIGIAKHTANLLTSVATTGNRATPGTHLHFFSESMADGFARYDTQNAQGSIYEPDDTTGVVEVGGNISLAAHPEIVGHFLYAALGVNNGTTTVVSGFYINSFINNTSDVSTTAALPPYAIEVYRPEISNGVTSYVYGGCCLTRLSMSFGVNRVVTLDTDWVGYNAQQLTRTTTTWLTYPMSPVYPYRYHQCSLSVGGDAYGHLESFAWEIDNQLSPIPTLNASQNIRRIARSGPPMVRFNGTMMLENYDDYTDFKNQTEIAITMGMFSANSYRCDITLPRCVITKHSVNVGGRDRIMANFEGIARYSESLFYTVCATISSVRSAYAGG